MQIEWKKGTDNDHLLIIDEKEILRMSRDSKGKRIQSLPHGPQWLLAKNSIWRSDCFITDEANQKVLECKTDKWYHSHFTVNIGQQSFKLFAQNNPLAEWRLEDEQKNLVLSYGILPETGKFGIRIQTGNHEVDPLLHCLLWAFMKPIAMESGTEFFLLLTAAS